MRRKIALSVWCHACILKFDRVSHLGLHQHQSSDIFSASCATYILEKYFKIKVCHGINVIDDKFKKKSKFSILTKNVVKAEISVLQFNC